VLQADPGAAAAAALAAREGGVITRALRGVALQVSPPLVVSEDELHAIVGGIAEVLRRGAG
jgi:adenosylmethionine-8-amino-7-oxononanoate aminotransferase